MTAEVPETGQRLTYDEWLSLPESNYQVELVDGKVIVNEPVPRHQRLLVRILSQLLRLCPPGYEVLPSLDWVLRSSNPALVRAPDLLILPEGFDEPRLTSPPLLAVEILSPSTVRTDLIRKRDEYAKAGLQHYLVADPDEPALAYYALSDGLLREVRPMSAEALELPEPFSGSIDPRSLLP